MVLNTQTNNATKTFIASLNLPTVADSFFRNIDDCNTYIEKFHGKKPRALQNLADFKQYQISNSMMTLDIFLDMCNNSRVQDAFEETFFQPFTQDEIIFMTEVIEDGKLSFEELYFKFQENPRRNIIRHFK